MAFRHAFHIGTFFLLVSTALLLATSISSPVIPDIGFLKVTLTNATSRRSSSVTFGALGHCVLDVATPDGSDHDDCSSKTVGYDIAGIISDTTGTDYHSSSLKDVTRGLVLHPVAAGLSFFALIIAISSSCVGFLFAAAVAGLAWVVTLVVFVLDLSLFGTVKHHVNEDGSGAVAKFSIAIWLTLAAFVVLFFATITTCFSCFSDRRRKYGNRDWPAQKSDLPVESERRDH